MKRIMLSAVFMLSSVSAYGFNMPNVDFPTESGWAVAMTALACDVDISLADGYVGTITKEGGVVVYRVFQGGVPVMSAAAKNTTIWANKTCLNG